MTPTIAGFEATCDTLAVGADTVAMWRVRDLERHVDRQALLAGDDPPEPPYWAHLWTGAVALAARVPAHAGEVVEIGCGLGLPGLVAARRGARVTFVDRVPAPLAFVRASLAANTLSRAHVVSADVAALPFRCRFDLVLAAEILYDRSAFSPLATAIARLIAPGGRALLTDACRTDTAAFYVALDQAGLRWHVEEEVHREESLPVRVRVVEIRHA